MQTGPGESVPLLRVPGQVVHDCLCGGGVVTPVGIVGHATGYLVGLVCLTEVELASNFLDIHRIIDVWFRVT